MQDGIVFGDDEEHLAVRLPHFEVRGERVPAGGALKRCGGGAGVLLELLAQRVIVLSGRTFGGQLAAWRGAGSRSRAGRTR